MLKGVTFGSSHVVKTNNREVFNYLFHTETNEKVDSRFQLDNGDVYVLFTDGKERRAFSAVEALKKTPEDRDFNAVTQLLFEKIAKDAAKKGSFTLVIRMEELKDAIAKVPLLKKAFQVVDNAAKTVK